MPTQRPDRFVPPVENWSAVVLAAGLGQRMGGLAKPLIRVNGELLLSRLIQSAHQAGAHEVICAVSAATMQTYLKSERAPSANLRWEPVPTGGTAAHSLRRALTAVHPRSACVMVCLADQALIDAHAMQALLHAYANRPATCDMVQPWVNDAPGNPVVITAELGRQWLAFPDAPVGQAWREQHPHRVHRWHTNDTRYRQDIDTLDDVEALRAAGHRVDLPKTS